MTDVLYTTVASPIGEILLTGDERALTGIYMPPHRHGPEVGPGWRRAETEPLTAAAKQLEAYFAGTRRDFDLPLDPGGTEFQRRVWAALTEIPYGETRSYGEIAAAIGAPGAARAVGLANGRNPLSIVVQCHRVVGSTGALTGYGGGMERKRMLLDLERGALALVL